MSRVVPGTRWTDAALLILGAELSLAWATSGPLPPRDVARQVLAALLLAGLAHARPRVAEPLAIALVGAIVAAVGLVPWLWPVASPGGAALVVLAAGTPLLALRRRPIPAAATAMALAVVLSTPVDGPIGGWLLGLALAVPLLRRTGPWTLLGAAWLLAVAPRLPDLVRTARALGAQDDRPDVVLLTIDALRADAPRAWQGALPTPDRATSVWTPGSYTLPSLASLHTGEPVAVHGSGRTPGGFSGPRADLPPLAQRLTDAGWRTVALSAGDPFTGHTFGLLRGFSETEHPWAPTATPRPRGRAPHATARPLLSRPFPLPTPDDDAGTLTGRALAHLHRPGPPTWLWMHWMDVHLPYDDPPCAPEVLGRPGAHAALREDPWWSTEAGRACLSEAYTHAVARLAEPLDRLLRGVPDGTVVLLTADHGEALGEAGFEHGHSLDPAVTRVPLWVWGADLPEPTTDIDLLDVHATVLGLAGLRGTGPGRDLARPLHPRPIRLSGTLYGPPRQATVVDGQVRPRPDTGVAPPSRPAPDLR